MDLNMDDPTCQKVSYHCSVCDVKFSRKQHFEAHMMCEKHRLKANAFEYDKVHLVNQVELVTNMYAQLASRVARLERSKARSRQTTKNYVSNCGNTTTNINIAIRPHGMENWAYLPEGVVVKLMAGVNSCLPELVKRLHFHQDHPENRNIEYPNKKLSQMRTFDGKNWETRSKHMVIEELVKRIVEKLDTEYYDAFAGTVTNFIQGLWKDKMRPLLEQEKLDHNLKKRVEYAILDAQAQKMIK